METSRPDPPVVLGLADGATLADARYAFRRLAKQAHPDVGGTTEWFSSVVDAYRELARVLPAPSLEPVVRPASPYDRLLGSPAPSRSWFDSDIAGWHAAGRARVERKTFADVLHHELARQSPLAA